MVFKSLQTRIFIGYLIISYGLFFFSFFILFHLEKKSLKAQAIENSMTLNEVYAGEISRQIQKKIEKLKRISETQLHIVDRKEIMRQLIGLLNDPHYGFLTNFYVEEGGDVHHATGRKSNASNRDYFLEMVDEMPDYIISKPIIGKTSKQAVFVIGVPIVIDGKFAGMIAGSTALNNLSRVINEKKMPLNSYAWITDRDGLIVAHPDPDVRMTTNLEKNEKYVSLEGKTIWGEMRGKSEGFIQYFDNSNNEVKVLTFFEIDYANGWKLGITTLARDINAPIKKFQQVIWIIAVVTFIIMGVLNYWISRILIRPIRELTDAVSVSDKGYVRMLNMKVTDDEVGVLILSYNKMSEAIRLYTDNLEDIVKKRTEELRVLNDKLENKNIKLFQSNEELKKENLRRKNEEKQKEQKIKELRDAITEIKTLKGLIPICANCKKIRDDKGYWNILESYIQKHSNASFSHGMCPECSDKLYGEEDWYIEMKNTNGQKNLVKD